MSGCCHRPERGTGHCGPKLIEPLKSRPWMTDPEAVPEKS